MEDLKHKFGKRLQEVRKQKRLSQVQLAEAVDVSVDFIGLIERGINAPSFDTLSKLSTALDIKISELFTFND